MTQSSLVVSRRHCEVWNLISACTLIDKFSRILNYFQIFIRAENKKQKGDWKKSLLFKKYLQEWDNNNENKKVSEDMEERSKKI